MSVEISVGGVDYVPITQELYQELMAELERNQKARCIALEDARIELKAKYGTETLGEGLRRCSVWDLQRLPVVGGEVGNIISQACTRLADRELAAQAERAEAVVLPIAPGG